MTAPKAQLIDQYRALIAKCRRLNRHHITADFHRDLEIWSAGNSVPYSANLESFDRDQLVRSTRFLKYWISKFEDDVDNQIIMPAEEHDYRLAYKVEITTNRKPDDWYRLDESLLDELKQRFKNSDVFITRIDSGTVEARDFRSEPRPVEDLDAGEERGEDVQVGGTDDVPKRPKRRSKKAPADVGPVSEDLRLVDESVDLASTGNMDNGHRPQADLPSSGSDESAESD